MKRKYCAWQKISTGEIVQGICCGSIDALFEHAGFGAVDTDKPIKGFLAVEVEFINGKMVKVG